MLLCRVEDRRGFSHLTCARSPRRRRPTGSSTTSPRSPTTARDPRRSGALEDPRVTFVEELARWIVTYTAFGREGPGVSLAQTEDFRTFERLGMVMSPEDKNAALLPRRIDGDWVLFHRPTSVHGADVWLSRSSDLKSWRSPERVLGRRAGGWWDSARIGMGPPPLETEHGWLVVYHGVRETVAGGLYRAGLALLDLERARRTSCGARRSGCSAPAPTTRSRATSRTSCSRAASSTTARPTRCFLYYGAADTRIGLATASCSDVLDYLLACPPG